MTKSLFWGVDANDQAQLQARLVCCFDDFNQGLFDSYFRPDHEDCYSLWTCFKVQKQEGINKTQVEDCPSSIEEVVEKQELARQQAGIVAPAYGDLPFSAFAEIAI